MEFQKSVSSQKDYLSKLRFQTHYTCNVGQVTLTITMYQLQQKIRQLRQRTYCSQANQFQQPEPLPNRSLWLDGAKRFKHQDSMFSDKQDQIADDTQSVGSCSESSEDPEPEYCVVNFYHLVDISCPEQVVKEHRELVKQQNWDLKGRIYITPYGLNCQYSGPIRDAIGYAEHVAADLDAPQLPYAVFPTTTHKFNRLRLQYKPNLISIQGGMARLPITRPEERATPLNPQQFHDMLSQHSDSSTGAVVLDVRNGYEWDAGHFAGAERPKEEEFRETPAVDNDEQCSEGGGEHAVSGEASARVQGDGSDGEASPSGVGDESESSGAYGGDASAVPHPLRGKPLDTPVLMYCTGGIRCDVYSTWLRKVGYNNLYSLKGGVQRYFNDVGQGQWEGSLYVFDERMAVDSTLNSDASRLTAAVPCELCDANAELPHINCANVDCNHLFIACQACKKKYSGCCCVECTTAPRMLRPALLTGGNYGSYGNYVPSGQAGEQEYQIPRSDAFHKRRQRRLEKLKACRLEERKAAAERKKRIKESKKAAMEAHARNIEQIKNGSQKNNPSKLADFLNSAKLISNP